ncbi:ADP-ribosylglycohydrolase family protein [Carboxylicivirga mesophila]|uniref:ADP-ribosylglycohydrolase family protein n=1 Tax=Carboxylicivirga mesophila TaxID=1166478 RepID=A0ABS5K982_9BACT|nr:ADP-ribosylglycohydrolase family protein [Carboxylicivirga mesophila]MBS2211417.1 ADP-ribosylglycohydrolase family protein [Carboxylicivirga mesophila]
MKKLIPILCFIVVCFSCHDRSEESHYQYLSVEDYSDAVYASWIGQIIGNTYGLGYEFKYIDEAGPDSFPYGYDFTLEDLRRHDGAFSDDDTDIEYMYLTQMEKHGVEPSYYQLAEAWKGHVKERIWFANRMAVTLMHAGHYPPVTGDKNFNSEWFQIDPQLVNEIWAITAPGMIDYAVAKSEYAARITSDDFGLEPTLHYAAMFSAAFFEKNINELIKIGNKALTPGSRFAHAVEYVRQQHALYPDNWQLARQNVCDKYYVVEDYNRHSWAAVDATLNGALGIMALLYGQGDFQQTLDYACAFGMDADNQAATMCGLLGVVNGFESIPKELMYPLNEVNWEQPFNDSYKMITREGLTDAKISELAARTVRQGERIILAQGGEKVEIGGKLYYKIPLEANFVAPFELNPVPQLSARIGQPFAYPIHTGRAEEITLSVEGELPLGISLMKGQLSGTPEIEGFYHFKIVARHPEEEKSIDVTIRVFSNNKAHTANEIISNSIFNVDDMEQMRDCNPKTSLMGRRQSEQRSPDYYGYKWDEPQTVSTLIYNNGKPSEFYGWFTSFDVQFWAVDHWENVNGLSIAPKMNLDNTQWLKPVYQSYTIDFNTIETTAIKIIGRPGGIEKDANNAHLGLEFATSIGELEVY